MRLKEIIDKIENEEQFTSNEYDEVLERKSQIRAFYRNCQMMMIFDMITSVGFVFNIVDIDQMDSFIHDHSENENQKEEMYSTLQPI